jgi:hypothetical protein
MQCSTTRAASPRAEPGGLQPTGAGPAPFMVTDEYRGYVDGGALAPGYTCLPIDHIG